MSAFRLPRVHEADILVAYIGLPSSRTVAWKSGGPDATLSPFLYIYEFKPYSFNPNLTLSSKETENTRSGRTSELPYPSTCYELNLPPFNLS